MATRKAAKKKSRRTVMYSSGGKKLYAVRDAGGKFKDIQQYSRAHAMDIKRGSSAEEPAAAKKAAGKKTAKKTTRKTTSRDTLGKAVKGACSGPLNAPGRPPAPSSSVRARRSLVNV